MKRCAWAGDDPLMRAYHDEEWGVPQNDSRMLWEMLMLEGFQAGLSWSTILRKRDAFRKAFARFDPNTVARFGKKDIDRLMDNAGIVRARAKIEATIRGAQIYREMESTGETFDDFCWSFTGGQVVKGDGRTRLVTTALSEQMSKEVKRRSFKFVGPTIVYAWMPETWKMFGTGGDAKGQPTQTNSISQGTPDIRIKEIMLDLAYA
jgi:DNA-3-methyladenine glycosylase I